MLTRTLSRHLCAPRRPPPPIIRQNSQHSSSESPPAHPPVALIEEHNRCGIITLNRPAVLNAVNLDMVRLITPALQRWQRADSDRTLILIRSSGQSRAFCAGADITGLRVRSPEAVRQFAREHYTLDHRIGTCRLPYVALIDGITMGAGVGLSVHGRYRVATERTVFAMPETLIGLFPDVGGSYFLPRLAGELGTYLGLTGARLKGGDVLAAGIATHFCASERLAELEAALLECGSAAAVPQVLEAHCAGAVGEAEFSLAAHRERIDRCFGGDTVEEILRSLERDGSEFAQQTLAQLAPASPLSLKMTLQQLRRGAATDSLADCMRMEYRMASRLTVSEASDFSEGVRAMLVDRDNRPRWKYARLEDVPDDVVGSFFESIGATNPDLQL